MCEPIIREGETETNRALIITDGEVAGDEMTLQAFALNSNSIPEQKRTQNLRFTFD